jgi:hypothetical protein
MTAIGKMSPEEIAEDVEFQQGGISDERLAQVFGAATRLVGDTMMEWDDAVADSRMVDMWGSRAIFELGNRLWNMAVEMKSARQQGREEMRAEIVAALQQEEQRRQEDVETHLRNRVKHNARMSGIERSVLRSAVEIARGVGHE